MDSMEFNNMKGVMYEQAASSSKQVRQEEMRDAMVDEAAAMHAVPRPAMAAATFPMPQGLPQEQQNQAAAHHATASLDVAGSQHHRPARPPRPSPFELRVCGADRLLGRESSCSTR